MDPCSSRIADVLADPRFVQEEHSGAVARIVPLGVESGTRSSKSESPRPQVPLAAAAPLLPGTWEERGMVRSARCCLDELL